MAPQSCFYPSNSHCTTSSEIKIHAVWLPGFFAPVQFTLDLQHPQNPDVAYPVNETCRLSSQSIPQGKWTTVDSLKPLRRTTGASRLGSGNGRVCCGISPLAWIGWLHVSCLACWWACQAPLPACTNLEHEFPSLWGRPSYPGIILQITSPWTGAVIRPPCDHIVIVLWFWHQCHRRVSSFPNTESSAALAHWPLIVIHPKQPMQLPRIKPDQCSQTALPSIPRWPRVVRTHADVSIMITRTTLLTMTLSIQSTRFQSMD
jgi:hypothetical protein